MKKNRKRKEQFCYDVLTEKNGRNGRNGKKKRKDWKLSTKWICFVLFEKCLFFAIK
jgi:hypothetical protein